MSNGIIFQGTSVPTRKSVTTTALTAFQLLGAGAAMLKITNMGPSNVVYSIGGNTVTSHATNNGTAANINILLPTGATEYRLIPTTGAAWFSAVLAAAETSTSIVQFELGKFIA